MARIIFADKSETRELAAIKAKLAEINISLDNWPVPADPDAQMLLDKAALDDNEKEALLSYVEPCFEALERESGYSMRDLIVLHEEIPGLADMLGKFDKMHYHTDDEVRYVLAGKGYFGFVDSAGEQFMLEVSASDYINVPANTEHWFTLGDSRRVKAVRYFIDTSGWTPVYTEKPIAASFNQS